MLPWSHMSGPSLVATPAQRRRALVLAALCTLVCGAGLLWRGGSPGMPPAPCAQPALVGDVLVCDGSGAAPGARAWLAGARLDVNTATGRELEAIPGVGPALAGAIIEMRSARDGFTTWQELDDVPGIGPKTLAKLEGYLRVAPPE